MSRPGARAVLVADQVGGRLAGGVGTGRPQRHVLVEQSPGRVGVAVDQAAADEEDARPAAPADDRLVQVARGRQVAGPGGVGLVERPAGVGVAGQVVDLLAARTSRSTASMAGAVAEVAGAQLDPSGQVPPAPPATGRAG